MNPLGYYSTCLGVPTLSPLLVGEQLVENRFGFVERRAVAVRIDERRRRILGLEAVLIFAEAAVLFAAGGQPDIHRQAPQHRERSLEAGADPRRLLWLDQRGLVRQSHVTAVHDA